MVTAQRTVTREEMSPKTNHFSYSHSKEVVHAASSEEAFTHRIDAGSKRQLQPSAKCLSGHARKYCRVRDEVVELILNASGELELTKIEPELEPYLCEITINHQQHSDFSYTLDPNEAAFQFLPISLTMKSGKRHLISGYTANDELKSVHIQYESGSKPRITTHRCRRTGRYYLIADRNCQISHSYLITIPQKPDKHEQRVNSVISTIRGFASQACEYEAGQSLQSKLDQCIKQKKGTCYERSIVACYQLMQMELDCYIALCKGV